MGEGTKEQLEAAREALAAADGFEPSDIEVALEPLLKRLDVKPGQLYQPIRVAVTGTTVSPGIFETLAALGREESLHRIDDAIARLSE
jgi:glutamyl-tRNA synthetase